MFFPIVLSPAPKPDPASRLTKPAEGVDTSPHPATETEIPAAEPARDTETVYWIDGQALAVTAGAVVVGALADSGDGHV